MQSKRFIGKVVMVTGASGGIGRACVDRFLEEGAHLSCLSLSKQPAADSTALRADRLTLSCDVTDDAGIASAVQTTLDHWGRLDVLVTSAGIYTSSPLPEVSLKQWQHTIDTNLAGVFLSNQAVAPIMMEQGSGSIINLSSMAGKTSWPASAQYSASKSGVIGLTRSVAMELAPYGITANAVCPGNTWTPMVKKVAAQAGAREGLTPDEWLKKRAEDCPMKRLAQPWEIAGTIAFLASEDARYITGQAIEVDGGMVMN